MRAPLAGRADHRAAGAAPDLPAALVSDGCVAVRQSSHPTAQALVARFGGPLTTTSANRAGEPPADHAARRSRRAFAGRCRILHGGATAGRRAEHAGARARRSKLEILRRGAIEIDPGRDLRRRDKG